MKNNFILLCLTLGAIVMNACSPVTISNDDFDVPKWKSDQDGCQNIRITMIDDLIKIEDQLKGLGEIDLVKFLGKPDFKNLTNRKQKFYTYYLSEGIQCGDDNPDWNFYGDRVLIRINAIGQVSEISIEYEK